MLTQSERNTIIRNWTGAGSAIGAMLGFLGGGGGGFLTGPGAVAAVPAGAYAGAAGGTVAGAGVGHVIGTWIADMIDGSGGPGDDGDDCEEEDDDTIRAKHAKEEHSEWNNHTVDEVKEIMNDVRTNGEKFEAGNKNIIYKKGKTILIDNKYASNRGTMFIRNESSRSINRYIQAFLRQNK